MAELKTEPLLDVKNLRVTFHTPAGSLEAARSVSFSIHPGEVVGLVGESGCGKSVTAQSILRLLPSAVTTGEIWFRGENLVTKSEKAMESLRGNQIGMVFQDPMTSLNPTMRIGRQVSESLRRHRGMSAAQAGEAALELLHAVGIPDPDQRMQAYPHSLSGGMRQRIVIAIAIACRPALLIADEPTTALDVTIQAQILDLMKSLNQQGTSLLLITHDLGVVAGMCQRVVVMYAGEVVETGTVDEIFYEPKHPYTKALLQAIPKRGCQRLLPIEGAPPDLLHPPQGCPFHPRCRFAMRICEQQKPLLEAYENGHAAACWLHHPHGHASLARFTEDT